MGLGDLKLTSKGIIIHDADYFVTLTGGDFEVPYYDENERKILKMNYTELELEMGIDLLPQIDQQMQLDDQLSAGNLLMTDILDWFGF